MRDPRFRDYTMQIGTRLLGCGFSVDVCSQTVAGTINTARALRGEEVLNNAWPVKARTIHKSANIRSYVQP
ncbi:hypothetical protein J6590_032822 [Homalodisca vitripennis]|nr:hypothetical protein J6590_032822 [Homalodisca vitripennis]